MGDHLYSSIERRSPGSIGWRVHYHQEVGSTQDVAAKLAAAGAHHGTVVIAETQTAGRGRMGRRWHSPAGANLYTTVILRPKLAIAEVPKLSLMAGVAAAEAIEPFAPKIVSLKWPNDLWLNGRKAGGMIAEAVSDSENRLAFVLLGIGLNLNLRADQLPEELRATATSLLIETGRPCDRSALASALFSRLDARYMEIETQGFDSVFAVWQRYSALNGKRVTVVNGEAKDTGVVKGIDADGALLLETDQAVKRILAGDVTIQGAYDSAASRGSV